MNYLVTIPFHQQSIFAIEQNGKRWVAMKPICEAIGIDWEPQRKRIKRDPVLLSVTSMMEATGSDEKRYKMLFLDLDYLNGWLFGIDANRVNADRRERVIEYQRECYKVLAGHFLDKDRGALAKAHERIAKTERAYFKRYPDRQVIRALALKGEPYWYIGRVVQRTAGTVSRAIRDMISFGLMTQRALDIARIGIAIWSRHRRKYVNQLTFGF